MLSSVRALNPLGICSCGPDHHLGVWDLELMFLQYRHPSSLVELSPEFPWPQGAGGEWVGAEDDCPAGLKASVLEPAGAWEVT